MTDDIQKDENQKKVVKFLDLTYMMNEQKTNGTDSFFTFCKVIYNITYKNLRINFYNRLNYTVDGATINIKKDSDFFTIQNHMFSKILFAINTQHENSARVYTLKEIQLNSNYDSINTKEQVELELNNIEKFVDKKIVLFEFILGDYKNKYNYYLKVNEELKQITIGRYIKNEDSKNDNDIFIISNSEKSGFSYSDFISYISYFSNVENLGKLNEQ